MKEELPEGWFPASKEDEARFLKELSRELVEGHLLYSKKLRVVAHRDGATDDVLFQHLDDENRYSVVHLTWSIKPEIDARFPVIEVDGTYEMFLEYES